MSSPRRRRTPPATGWILGLVILAAAPRCLDAQVVAVRAGAGVGRVIPVSAFEDGANLAGRPIRTVVRPALEVGWRWSDASLRDPEFGFGVSTLDVRDTEELGTSVSLYGYTRLPLAGTAEGSGLTFDAALGAAFGWREFDPVANPRQIAIGSPVTATFALGLSGRVALDSRWAAIGTAAYHHWSNGNLRQPNIGFNAMVGGVGLEWRRSAPTDAAGSTDRRARPVGSRRFVQLFAGARGLAADPRHTEQDDRYERQLFAVAGVHVGVRRPVSRLWDLSLALSGTLDTSGFRDHRAPTLRDGRIVHEAALSFGVASSGHLRTGPVELEFGVGWAPVDVGGARGTSRWSQRLGVHFTAVPGVTPSVVLRALGFDRPDFIEWGLAFR